VGSVSRDRAASSIIFVISFAACWDLAAFSSIFMNGPEVVKAEQGRCDKLTRNDTNVTQGYD
jgi:hypothetical protein